MALEEAPPFWWEKPGWQALLLSPFSLAYGKITAKRMSLAPSSTMEIPVICVGNFIIGGAGKTPTVIMLAKYFRSQGMKPGILSRGYGGGITEPTIVDVSHHNAHDVGDEPLLHARHAVTVVSVERPSGAKLLAEKGCDIILMDDGFQNPSLKKDFCLVVVDSKRGLGNGFTVPAGPLRVSLKEQLRFTDAILVIGDDNGADKTIRKAARSGKPVFHANLNVVGKTKWKGQKVLAFAGIADPGKFFHTLEGIGAEIEDRQTFGDHHYYNGEECEDLLQRAEQQELTLVTTTKDLARLQGMGESQNRLAENSNAITVELVPDDPRMIKRILEIANRRVETTRVG